MIHERTLYDITRPIAVGSPVWPGDTDFALRWSMRTDAGDAVNLGSVCLSLHTGTHADAPFHVDGSGATIGDLPVLPFIGTAVLADITSRDSLDAHVMEVVLAPHPGTERLLLRTGAWRRGASFPIEFPALEPAGARYLVEAGVRLVGTDAPSVDVFDSAGLEVHHILAEAGVVILENLWLDGVPEGTYELIALPLRLTGADASPVRAVLRTR